ncbi:MAG: hypothetical protein FJZ96_03805 [Chloroflexi bacterium]|nr:hypothetical protein [Chloroflexota bacterium]
MNRLVIALKALRQLGLQQVGLYALYKFGLAAGHYQRATAGRPLTINHLPSPIVCHPLFDLPARADLLAVLGSDGKTALLAEADEIIAGKVRLFGADPAPLQLAVPGKLTHWTAYETGRIPLTINHLPIPDIKFVWEPARFGWAFTLGRAFRVTGGEKYAEAFWKYFETFTDANPPCLGPHWMSGQEVALRLMAFAWAGQVFDAAPASTPERKRRLADSVAAHAARIPPTLIYARSQHNNHLLAESAGLLTAGLALPEHPESARWQRLGQMWLDHGFRSQIDAYGEYAQRSANYHRLMLQVALWVRALTTKGTKEHKGKNQVYRSPTTYHPRRGPVVGAVQSLETLDSAPLSPSYMKKISAATHWLLSLMDSESGRTPNLGANDGAYIFPLTICPFSDYRPVAHAAARAFLDYELPRGPWDEMALWFGAQARTPRTLALPRYPGDQIYGKDSWAYLRTAQFTSRPSHADQLHLDLWWRGLNIAQDAGAYLYNAPAPWDNSLTTALVHNTVTVNGRDQFARAGRFLYLDWFDAYRTSEIAADPQILQQVSGRYRACPPSPTAAGG